MKKFIFAIGFQFTTVLFVSSQITGGNSNYEKSPESEPLNHSVDLGNHSVNEFNGQLSHSLNLGTITLPNGLSYTQYANYSNNIRGGSTSPFLSGVPYGEGWNLSLPQVRIKWFISSKYSDDERRLAFEFINEGVALAYTGTEPESEGEATAYFPEVSIPGMGSFLMTYKCPDQSGGNIFIPINFDTYFELTYTSDGNWFLVLPDGTIYTFEERYYTTVNPTNQRYHTNLITGTNSLKSSIAPKFLATTWYITSINQPNNNEKYRIKFEYNRFGNFNYHKNNSLHIDDYNSCLGELSFAKIDSQFLSKDIFLKRIIGGINFDKDYEVFGMEQLILEKLEFIYEEDESLHKDGILNTNENDGRTIKHFDSLYYYTDIYDAKNGGSTFQNIRKYAHKIHMDPTESQPSSSLTNPYLYNAEYNRKLITGQATIDFDHSFLETDKVATGQDLLALDYAPPGDIYEVNAEVSSSQFLQGKACTFDVNVTTGVGNDQGPSSTTEYTSYSVNDYNVARSSTIFSTFNSLSKWNTYSFSSPLKTSLTISSFFSLSNINAVQDGFYVQIGPGSSDVDYSKTLADLYDYADQNLIVPASQMGRMMYWNYAYYNQGAYSNLYNQDHQERYTHPLPSNFGNGYLPHNYWKIVNKVWFNPSSSCGNYLNSSVDFNDAYNPFKGKTFPITNPSTLYNSSTYNQSYYPTTSKGVLLVDLKVRRYSKTTYVLKKVEYSKINSDGDDLCHGETMEPVSSISFDYITHEVDLKANSFYVTPPTSSGQRSVIGKRYVVLLDRVNFDNISDPQQPSIVTYFSYSFKEKMTTTPQSVTDVNPNPEDDPVTLYYFTDYAEGFAMTEIINPTGKKVMFQYSYDNEWFKQWEYENYYKNYYYKEPYHNRTQDLYYNLSEAPPGFSVSYAPLVSAVITDNELGTSKTTYQFSIPVIESLPYIPGKTSNSRKGSAVKSLSPKMESLLGWGFKQVTIREYAEEDNGLNNIFLTTKEYYDDFRKFGKIKTEKRFSRADNFSNPEIKTEYEYTEILAFENFHSRFTYAPTTTGVTSQKMLTRYDYADKHKGYLTNQLFNDLMVTAPIEFANFKYTGKIKGTLKAKTSVGTEYISYSNESYAIWETLPSGVNEINSLHGYLNSSYFVNIKKITTTTVRNGISVTDYKEYDYFAADDVGNAIGEGWKYVMDFVDGTTPIKLYFEPSWQLYSLTEYSDQFPNSKSIKENFYYYDLLNRYGAFAPEITGDYLIWSHAMPYLSNIKDFRTNKCLPFVENGLEGLAMAANFNVRTATYETRSGILNESKHLVHSKYFLYRKPDEFYLDNLIEVTYDVTGNYTSCTYNSTPTKAKCDRKFVEGPYLAEECQCNPDTDLQYAHLDAFGQRVFVYKGCLFATYNPATKDDLYKLNAFVAEDDGDQMWDIGQYDDRNVGTFILAQLHKVEITEGFDLSEYSVTMAPTIHASSLDNFDVTNDIHQFIGEFTVNALSTIGAYIDLYDLDLQQFRDIRSPEEVTQILYEGIAFSPATGAINDLPYDAVFDDVARENQYPCGEELRFRFGISDIWRYNPVFHKEIEQIDNVVKQEYQDNYAYYNINTLPPILKWDFKPDESINCFVSVTAPKQGSDERKFWFYTPNFPYDAVDRKVIRKYNPHRQPTEIEDQNGLVTKIEYNNKIELLDIRSSMNVPVKKVFCTAKNIGLPTKVIIGDGRSDHRFIEFTYSTTGLLTRKINRTGQYVDYLYDGFNRLEEVSNNEGVIKQNHYNYWNTSDLYPLSPQNYYLPFDDKISGNFIESRTFLSSNKYSSSRVYYDPLGREFASVSQGYDNSWYNWKVIAGYASHDGLGNKTKTYKAKAETVSGFDPLAPTRTAIETNNLFVKNIPDNNRILSATTETIPVGRTQGVNTITGDISFISLTDFMNETQVTTLEMDMLFPLRATETYILLKSLTTNSDGKESYSYTNLNGELVATLQNINSQERALTLHVYDEWSRPVKIIDPIKQETEYFYNQLGQVYKSIHSAKGISTFMYNKSGQVVLYMDPNLRGGADADKKCRKYDYDIYGRLVEQSIIDIIQPAHLDCAGIQCYWLSPLGHQNSSYSILGTPEEYTFSSISTLDWTYKVYEGIPGYYWDLNDFLDVNSKKLEHRFYYDYTPTHSVNSNGAEFNNVHSLALGSMGVTPRVLKQYNDLSVQDKFLNHLTAVKTFNPDGNVVIYKFFAYDNLGRLSDEFQQFNPKGITSIDKGRLYRVEYANYDRAANLGKKIIYMQGSNSPVQELAKKREYSYSYDAFGRLTGLYFNSSGGFSGAKRVASFEYDNALGFLTKKKYYATDNSGFCEALIDEIEYDVLSDAQNRLKKINSRLFSWHMWYDGDAPGNSAYVQSIVGSLGNIPQHGTYYDGRINATMSEYKLHSSIYTISNIGSFPQEFDMPALFGYSYDDIGRLTAVDASVYDYSALYSTFDIGDESFEYDESGNILGFFRQSLNGNTIDPQEWDYQYTNNKLSEISQVDHGTVRAYTYDGNGNISSEYVTGKTSLEYYHDNRLYEFNFEGKKIEYLYNEKGERIYRKISTSGVTNLSEFYLIDASGAAILIEELNNTQTGVGLMWNIPDVGQLDESEPTKVRYRINDHLGNTRLVYTVEICQTCGSNCGDPSYLDYEIQNVMEYFAYGKILRKFDQSDPDRYPTTGNERDEETGWDYRIARFYDADIGRFLGVDPLAGSFPWQTPYSAMDNNPISKIDPNGRAAFDPNPPTFNVGINISIGSHNNGVGLLASISQSFGNWNISAGFGATGYGSFANTGKRGLELRGSLMSGFNDGFTSVSLGTNVFRGVGGMSEFSQRTGILNIGVGQFSASYENDGYPFALNQGGGRIFGDGDDKYRTAAVRLGFGKFSAGFNLFTGMRKDYSGDNAKIGQLEYGQFGERMPHGFVNETGTPYRMGAAYVGYGGTKIGIDSDRWLRHPIQDNWAHNMHKPDTRQPGFRSMSNTVNPYAQTNSTFGSSTPRFTLY